MFRFYAFAYALSRIGAVVAALAVVFMVGVILLEIVLRSVFSTSTFVTDEFVGYAVSVCVIWSLGYVLEHEELIRVNLILSRLSPRGRDLFSAVSAFVVALATAGLIWMFWLRAARAWSRGTVSSSLAAVPTWIPESAMMIGLGIFLIQLVAFGLRHLYGHPSLAPRAARLFTE
ncbi:MAG: TRAP transporter small permease [Paracoccus sp. (in: a-proteobacteria)]|nr:TRAP transporter small permease [Paracoccus sp. (in: a-proteobacteria)]